MTPDPKTQKRLSQSDITCSVGQQNLKIWRPGVGGIALQRPYHGGLLVQGEMNKKRAERTATTSGPFQVLEVLLQLLKLLPTESATCETVAIVAPVQLLRLPF